MELRKIKILLEKYECCETTLDEERVLQAYFSKSSVPQELEPYKQMFAYYAKASNEAIQQPLKVPYQRHRPKFWVGIAAAVMFGAFVFNNLWQPKSQFSDEELVVYNNVRTGFSILTTHLNKGKRQLNFLKLFNTSITKGKQQISYLETLNTTTNQIFNLNK